MSAMRDQLEKLLQKAEDKQTKDSAVYRKLLKEKANTEKKLRKACTVASESANNLAAIRKALKDLPAEAAA